MTQLPPYVTIAETDSDGAPIALLPGFLESPALWQAMPKRLWSGHRAIAFSLPGHAPWKVSRQELEMLLTDDEFLDRYAALLERLEPGRSWRLVGHSTGAMIALALAKRAPHLVSDVCAIAPLFSGAVCGRNLQGALVRLPVVGQLSFRWLIARWLAAETDFREGVRTVTARANPELSLFDGVRTDLADSDPDQMYRFGVWIGQQDMSKHLRDIDRPVHAIICDHDPVVVPTHQIRLISEAPRATAVMLNSGHLPMLETQTAFARAFVAWRNYHTPGAVSPGPLDFDASPVVAQPMMASA